MPYDTNHPINNDNSQMMHKRKITTTSSLTDLYTVVNTNTDMIIDVRNEMPSTSE